MSADFVAHMEDVLDLYAEPYDPQRPVVCFDETSTQLLADARPPIPAAPGQPRREDYEYRRQGTCNLFLAGEPLAGWRQVAVTERRTMQDFAQQMRWLVDEAYPEADLVRVVLDNLNTHRIASRCTRPSRQPRLGALRSVWSFTIRPSTAVGSIWRKSSSASCLAVASASGSPMRKPFAEKWQLWSASATRPESSSTGASLPSMPG